MFGEIWLEQPHDEGTMNQRAVKILSKPWLNKYEIDDSFQSYRCGVSWYITVVLSVHRFIRILVQYQREEVFVKFLGWFDNADALDAVFLAMEYFPYGDLDQYISDQSSRMALRKTRPIEIASDLLEGLEIMHAEGFAHRDLKPQVGFPVPACQRELKSSC